MKYAARLQKHPLLLLPKYEVYFCNEKKFFPGISEELMF